MARNQKRKNKKTASVALKKTSRSSSAAEKKAEEPNSSPLSNRLTIEPSRPAPEQNNSANFPTSRFPIVGIGASAGGLEALQELLDHMPADTGMAFVVVTHQHPGHTSLLPELLARNTDLPVVEARDGLAIVRDHIYVGSPGGHLAIMNGILHRMETGKQEAPRLPIDYFFRSLAEDQREKAICIILSGTGADGTLGLKAIKGELGMVMVEEPQSAKYSGMPASAISTGLADFVLPPAAMPKQLIAYAQGPYLCDDTPIAEEQVLPKDALQKILLLLRARTSHDFSGYKPSTLRRRIERRMNIHQIDQPNQYVRYLQEYPLELDILFKELLINVTNFFRDPAAWEALLSGALPELIESRPEGYTIRGWVPGCASGEEVYSLAIAIRECMEKYKKHFEVQIFGTDIEAEAIEAARAGQYPDGIAVDVSAARLDRYFARQDDVYRIRKDIREMTVFAPQNVIKDPPFTKLDVISCRNLLIYLNTDLQKRLLPIFHYALKPGGILFLGSSETVGSLGDLFATVDKRWKIFRRKETVPATHSLPEIPVQLRHNELSAAARMDAAQTARDARVSAFVERLLLQQFAPASVVVSDSGNIVYIHGRTGAYLEPAEGQPRNNILEMAREGLQIELAMALRQAATQDKEVVRENVRVKTNGGYTRINFSVTKISDPEGIRGLLIVTFREASPSALSVAPVAKDRRRKSDHSDRTEHLERELRYAKESLQTAVEELKSANEELQSTNEELQSTNEELETSKEEMQSLNEELTTVNAELQSKVDDLSQANDDMQNLLNSTDIATMFLDNDLNIMRFTEKATTLVTLRPNDVGRPIDELTSNLEYDDLFADCRVVLKTLAFKETEVCTKSGIWYLMRIMPYRTADNVIDGLVLTFVDISRLKEAQRDLRRMSKVFMAAADPILILDLNGGIMDLNDEAVRAHGFSRSEMLGQRIQQFVPEDQQSKVYDLLTRCGVGEALRNAQCVRLNKDAPPSTVLVSLSLMRDESGGPEAIAMIAKPIAAQPATLRSAGGAHGQI